MGWIRLGKNCPVCNGDRTDCRQNSENQFVHCRSENPSLSGFEFLGDDNQGFQMYLEASLASDKDYREKCDRRKTESKKKQEKQLESTLHPVARDRYYRKLLDELSLESVDFADLTRRGFTHEQISRIGFKTALDGQPLKGKYPKNLPGVSLDGRSLFIKGDGYLCPVYQGDLIVGCQRRLRDGSDGRYRWLTTKLNPVNLKNGELPLAICKPSTITDARVYLVEGLGAKPWLTAERLEAVVIGASGGNWAASPEQLIQFTKNKEIILIPDGGAIANPQVMKVYAKVAELIPNLKVLWYEQISKGMDADEVPVAMLKSGRVIPYGEFSESDENESTKKKSNIPVQYTKSGKVITPKGSTVVRYLQEIYQPTLAYNPSTQSFWRYNSDRGIWCEESDLSIKRIIQAELDSADLQDSYDFGYVNSVYGLMSSRLLSDEWDGQNGLIPFMNGVYEIASGEFLPHSSGYRLTWQLPYKFDPGATCQPIIDWLLESHNGNRKTVELLRAYLKAVLTGRTDIQKFLECIGFGGTGKSTFSQLAIALVGVDNTLSTNLKELETNRFECAAIYGKRLVLIADSDRYGGSVAVLKNLTGGDPLRYEVKNRQQGQSFTPEAMVLLTANQVVQSSDYSSGLQRRRITVPWRNVVQPGNRRNLITINQRGVFGEFVEYLPGLFNWVISLSDADMVKLLLNHTTESPELDKWRIETLLGSNPLAAWFDQCCVLEPGAKTYVGNANEIRTSEGDQSSGYTSRTFYAHWESKLYPSYCQFAKLNGYQKISHKRFSTDLEDLLVAQLQLPVTKADRPDRIGMYFLGVAIRSKDNDELPLPISGQDAAGNDDVMVQTITCDGSVMVETHTHQGCDGCDGSEQLKSNREENADYGNTESKYLGEFVVGELENLEKISDSDLSITSITSASGNGSNDRSSITCDGSNHHTSDLGIKEGDLVSYHGDLAVESCDDLEVVEIKSIGKSQLATVTHPGWKRERRSFPVKDLKLVVRSQKIKKGDRVIYTGADYGHKQICQQKTLEVVSVDGAIATVTHDDWMFGVNQRQIPMGDLKLVKATVTTP